MRSLLITFLVSMCVAAASLNDHQNKTIISAELLERVFIYEDFADINKARERWIPSHHKEYENQPYVLKVYIHSL